MEWKSVSTKLNATNYFKWLGEMEIIIFQKGLNHHIKYSSFNDYFDDYFPPSTREVRYRTTLLKIESDKNLSADEREILIIDLEDKFKEFSSWD
jgi:hypothetical protein